MTENHASPSSTFSLRRGSLALSLAKPAEAASPRTKGGTARVNFAVVGLALLGASSLLSACVGPVDVGDATGGSGGTSGADGTGGTLGEGTGGSSEPSECSERDITARAGYDAWRAQTNDFGALAGATFTGYVEGGEDLTLTIGADHSATLVVGEAAPAPVADLGYLCADPIDCVPQQGLATGGTYPIHGATFESDRLQVPLQAMSAYEPWCLLQEPVAWGDCQFRERPNVAIMWGETCAMGEEEVDCSYLALVFTPGVCLCTSVECLAGVQSTEPTMVLDVRFDAAEDKLEGSIGSANVHLFRATE